MHDLIDLYAVLGVAPSALTQVIRAAYRVMTRLHHPDANIRLMRDSSKMDSSKMALINRAYDILSCPKRRHDYDLSLRNMQKLLKINRINVLSDTNVKANHPATVLTTYDHRGRLHAYV